MWQVASIYRYYVYVVTIIHFVSQVQSDMGSIIVKGYTQMSDRREFALLC